MKKARLRGTIGVISLNSINLKTFKDFTNQFPL